MEWVEVTARTVPEARERALDHLGVDESQAEFEVVEEPRTGLFGRVKGVARVRARVSPKVPRPKAERRERRRPRGREATTPGDDAASSAPRAPAERPRPREAARPDRAERAARSEGEGGGPPGRRSGVGGTSSRSARAHEEERVNVNDESTAATGSGGPSDDGRQTEHAVTFLEGLVGSFGLSATVSVVEVDELYDEVRIEGSDLGMLIGQKAATLEAVQELSRVVASRRSGGRGESRFRVDVGGYRQRRREALERFAVKLADEVRTGGTSKALEPMSSADRKVIHDTVGALTGVGTISEGEEPRRRVVIVPSA